MGASPSQPITEPSGPAHPLQQSTSTIFPSLYPSRASSLPGSSQQPSWVADPSHLAPEYHQMKAENEVQEQQTPNQRVGDTLDDPAKKVLKIQGVSADAATFDLLNAKDDILNQVDPTNLPIDSSVDGFSILGIHISLFDAVIEKCGGRNAVKGKSTHQICEEFVKPFTRATLLSLCEQIYLLENLNASPSPKQRMVEKANWYISHAWQADFLTTLDTITLWFEEHKIPSEESYVYFDLFSDRQYPDQDNSKMKRDNVEWFLDTFVSAMEKIGKVVVILLPLSTPVVLNRAWCAWELYAAARTKSQYEIAISDQDRKSLGVDGILKLYNLLADYAKGTLESNSAESLRYISNAISLQVGLQTLQTLGRNMLFTGLEREITSSCLSLREKGRQLRDYDSAVAVLEGNVEDLRATSTTPSAALSQDLCNLGTFYFQLKKHDLAIAKYKEGLENEISRNAGQNSILKLIAQKLIEVYLDQKMYAEAEKVALYCIDDDEKNLDPKDPARLASIEELINVYVVQNKPDSETYLLKSLDLSRDIYGPEDSKTTAALSRLGAFYADQKRYDQAETTMVKVTELLRGKPEELQRLLGSLISLAVISSDVGKYEQSRDCYIEFLDLAKKAGLYGRINLDLVALENLAMVYSKLNDLIKTAEVTEDYLEIAKKRMGPTHASVLEAYENLIRIYSHYEVSDKKERYEREYNEVINPKPVTELIDDSHEILEFDGFSLAGLPLAFITSTFIEMCGGRSALIGKTTTDVCTEFVMPWTKESGLSLCKQLELKKNNTNPTTKPRKATWFISHAWKYQFLDVVDSLQYWFDQEGNSDPLNTIIWFDLFTNSQHGTASRPFEWWSGTFLNAVGKIGQVLMVLLPWDNPIPLTRAWCVFELYSCAKTNSRFEIAFPPTEAVRLLGGGSQSFLKALSVVRAQKSEAFLPTDRERIHKAVEDSIGFVNLDRLTLSVMANAYESQLKRFLQKFDEAEIQHDPITYLKVENELGMFYLNIGKIDKAEEALVDAYERLDKFNHPYVIRAMRQLVSLYCRTGDLKKAENLCLAAKARAETFESEGQEERKGFDGLLGFVYEKQGRYAETRPLFEAALEEAREEFGVDHASTLRSMNNLAYLYGHMGLNELSEKMYFECLERRRKVLGPEHYETLVTANNLASLYQTAGRLEEAEKLHLECLQTRQRMFGDKHEDVWHSMSNLSVVYKDMGRKDEEEKYMKLSVKLAEEIFEEHHPKALSSLNNLAVSYVDAGDLDEAAKLLRLLVQRAEKAGVASLFEYKFNLATVLRNQDKLDEAEVIMADAYESAVSGLGSSHLMTVSICNSLAKLYDKLGNKELAVKYFEIMTSVGFDKLGLTSDTFLAQSVLVTLYRETGNEKLIQACERFLALSKQACGEKDDLTLKIMSMLAQDYGSAKRYEEGIRMLKDLRKLSEEIRGHNHPQTIETLSLQGMFSLNVEGMDEEGREALSDALQRAEAHGEDHENARIIREFLERLDKRHDDPESFIAPGGPNLADEESGEAVQEKE
ncbi:Kinesin light chain 3 [Phlyctochytrium planicorne]|nr:Kinesin light chain 3 [Phlyctochytrium planicorne]